MYHGVERLVGLVRAWKPGVSGKIYFHAFFMSCCENGRQSEKHRRFTYRGSCEIGLRREWNDRVGVCAADKLRAHQYL